MLGAYINVCIKLCNRKKRSNRRRNFPFNQGVLCRLYFMKLNWESLIHKPVKISIMVYRPSLTLDQDQIKVSRPHIYELFSITFFFITEFQGHYDLASIIFMIYNKSHEATKDHWVSSSQTNKSRLINP